VRIYHKYSISPLKFYFQGFAPMPLLKSGGGLGGFGVDEKEEDL